ncbi:Anaphase-promoting complex subunit 10 [Quillaja saponaria]|uniref:Anaphase-promoting complex subunit 10 n=1 Tax=Quillaja saponaria TaxID=32244 RepID=A0AAD7L7V3_QUISA|nr:Anaphase-promoting complex subunit 10 [Quillaja saponaria]
MIGDSRKMAAESSVGEEEVKLTRGNQILIVDEDLREMGKKASWECQLLQAWKWRLFSSGRQCRNLLALVVLYVDFKLDESYTPRKISIRAGDGFHNLKEIIKTGDLAKPTGWVYLSLPGNDPRETFVNTFMLQIAVLSNHLNGRDTNMRQIKVYGPQPNPIPHQPFQFTSRKFITYSSVR